ncbi:unnamed protein product [Citrullus colocynthis]|uniref:Uncharacterized protein n=1 Tax=Citrullus colocynthis TaxID=252529 RepID=A0ABP0ZCT9_9ROSI
MHNDGTIPLVPTIPAHNACSTSGSERSSQPSSSLSTLSLLLLRRSSPAKPHLTDSFIICIVSRMTVSEASDLAGKVTSNSPHSCLVQISPKKSRPNLVVDGSRYSCLTASCYYYRRDFSEKWGRY